jgi:hypothetical protein
MVEDSNGSSGIWTFWLGFIGNIDLLARVFVGNMDLLAKHRSVDLLCLKVKWYYAVRRVFNIPGLGAWTSALRDPVVATGAEKQGCSTLST